MHSAPSFSLSRTFLATVLALLLAASPAFAQDLADRLWTDVVSASVTTGAERQIVPNAYRSVRMDGALMASLLAEAPLEAAPFDTRSGVIVPLPTPDGGFASFRVVEAPIMEAGLQARYPELRTYYGRGVEAKGSMVRISATPEGFHAFVLGKGGSMLIDPMQALDTEHYVVYRKRDYVPDQARVLEAFGNEEVIEAPGDDEPVDVTTARPENGELLRTYRLAMAATGEYTAFHSARRNRPSNVADGLAAIIIAMNRVNGIYERDLSVRMVLIDETDQVIYTDGTSDPYTNNSGGAMLGENQSNLDAVIGSDNYDVGHVFSTGGGGVAGLGVVCRTGQKGRGVTGLGSPINDIFYVDFVSHEIGHQFRGNHSFNGSSGNCSGGNRNGSTAYEPGSGSTIMAYAGICNPQNLQNTSDDYFHAVSLIEIVNYISVGAGNDCAEETETENSPPVVMSDVDGLSIPIETPFVLTGSAEDDNNDPEDLTYTWEEFDLGPAGPPAGGTGWNGTPPFFRSFDPVDEPVRYFPALDRLIAGNPPVIGEGLPSSDGRLRFRLTARDNAGGIGDLQVTLDVVEDAGPFEVTFANEGDLVYGTGSEQEVTWDVAGTDAGDVNTPTVDILFSADGGDTFDIVLAEGTDNDGAELVTMPSEVTDEARIMIRAVDNVFFAVNREEFALEIGVANEARPEATHSLSAVYPNPFGVTSSRATLNLTVEQSQAVRVAVYDALGRQVAVLHDGTLAAGQNRQLSLDAAALAGGTYFVRVVGETFTDVQQMTVVR
ncbi:MAG: reprolysin-like metallopeptidase [Rhodothermales bacterium]